MSTLLISCSSCSFEETLWFVQCSYLLKSWVLLMSATNCCKIIAPRLPWVCTNFLTGLVEATAASDNEDSLEWQNCKQYWGVSTNQRDVKLGYLFSESREPKRQNSVHENVLSVYVWKAGGICSTWIYFSCLDCVYSPWCTFVVWRQVKKSLVSTAVLTSLCIG